MCGIAGIFSYGARIELGTIKRFTDAIAHRGPDGSDYVLLNEDKVALGHRRLSILDLSDAGKQPMQWQNRYTITYNGEVYNFIELKKELQENGMVFKTESDTEVILAAFQFWGKDCFHRFNGMWAIAIHDKESGELLLCRDRFGVKPLYYTLKEGEYFAFASETHAFRFLDNFELHYDEDLISWTMNDPVMIEGTGHTIWQHIHQLLPGHLFEIRSGDSVVQQKRWFEIPKKQSTLSYAAAQEEFFHLMEKAVNLRLRSDVPVATALSGGLDSSSVYSMLYHLKSKRLQSDRINYNQIKGFVATFEGTLQDETDYAKAVVEHWKGEAEFVKTDFNAIISNIESSTRLFNDITATPICVLGDVYKSMRQHGYVVSLDGHGADEMLYGYRSLVGMAIRQAIADLDEEYEKDLSETYLGMFHSQFVEVERKKLDVRSNQLKDLLTLNSTFGKTKYKVKRGLKKMLGMGPDVFHFQQRIANRHLYKKSINKIKDLSDKPIDLKYYISSERELAVDFYYRNIPYNMRDFDRAAMQHGIEIRMPFMDYNLVNFVFSLPMKYKVGHGFTKRVMRDAMGGLLPSMVKERKLKTGMGAPISDWFNNQLNTFLMDTVHSQRFLQNNLWQGHALKEEVEQKCSMKSWTMDEAQQFWNILNAHIILS